MTSERISTPKLIAWLEEQVELELDQRHICEIDKYDAGYDHYDQRAKHFRQTAERLRKLRADLIDAQNDPSFA